MAFGHLARLIFQVINIWYFKDSSLLTIWLIFPFACLTALTPIGFTMFAFRYYEVTSTTLILMAKGTMQEVMLCQRKVKFWKLAAIVELASGVILQSLLICFARQCHLSNNCTTSSVNNFLRWSELPNAIDQLTFTIVMVVLGVALHRIRSQLLIQKNQINKIMCMHYCIIVPSFIIELFSVVVQSITFNSGNITHNKAFVVIKSLSNALNMFQ